MNSTNNSSPSAAQDSTRRPVSVPFIIISMPRAETPWFYMTSSTNNPIQFSLTRSCSARSVT